jgi:hypothetical protein
MKFRNRAMLLPTLAVGAFLFAGCGGANNEENFSAGTGKGERKEGTPDFKSYADYAQHQAQQAAKDRPAGKGKKAPGAQPAK